MILHEHQTLFIHIPKTAGTSIESIFFADAHSVDVANKHRTLSEMLRLYPEAKRYFKFAFVRNPWDMTASMYSYLWKRPAFQRKYPEFAALSFSQWIQHPFFATPSIRSKDVARMMGSDGSFFDWIHAGDVKVDFVGKLESLRDDWETVCSLAGLGSRALPHLNRSQSTHYSGMYNSETAAIVGAKYSREISYFNYRFETSA